MSSENKKGNQEKEGMGTKKQKLSSMAESSNQGSSLVTRIPEDHLLSILLLLPIESILCFAATSKKLKSLAHSDSLWESIFRRDWGQITVDALKMGSNPLQQFPWKKLYQQLYQLDSVYCHRLNSPDGDLNLPTPRASHSLNLVSGCLVLFGGGCEGGRHLDDTWVAYVGNDFTRTLRWQRTHTGIPRGRFGHSCIVIDDHLILFGGINDLGTRHNDTWVGQLVVHETLHVSLTWRLLDAGPIVPPPRGAHAGCPLDDKRMLIHGGIGPSGERLGDMWILDSSDDYRFGTWREITAGPGPPPRSGHTLTHVGRKQTILFGGRGTGFEVLNDLWILDSSDEGRWEWTQYLFEMCDTPHGFSLPRVGHSASLIIGRRVLIYGGENSYRHRKDDFWVLDVENMSFRKLWKRVETKGEKVSCRSFHGACVDESGRYLFVHGGMMDGLVQPGDPVGLRFDGESFLVELLLQS